MILPVFQTPFLDDESVDFDTLGRELDWLLEQGADGVVMAMVSETLRLASEERDAVCEFTCQTIGRRAVTVISVGAESSSVAERHARHAERCGATMLMAIPPISVVLDEEAITDYYRRLIRAVAIPVIVQDASGYVGRPMSIEVQVGLMEEFGPERVRFKPEAPPLAERLGQLRVASGSRAQCYEGSGGVALIDSFPHGLAGTMPGADLIRGIVPLWRALQRGDAQTARAIHTPLAKLAALQKTLDAYLAVEKHLLVRQGIFTNTLVRGPVGWRLSEEDRSFILRRGECLGIIGPNGSGKTTFLKTILGKIEPLAGEVRWGTKVQIGYYAQQLDDLDDRNEIIMELRRVAASSATAGELRSFLGKFHFSGDDVYKHVADLSGGEKGRLALAKLIYSRVNVLVLDEPTNHLDIPSREALEEALDAYEGTIVTISHDRYFLDRVATQILALDGLGGAEHYDGDYTGYHDWRAAYLKSGERNVPKPGPGNLVQTAPEIKSENEPAVAGNPAAPQKTSSKKPHGNQVKTRNVKVIKKSKSEGARDTEIIEADIAAAEKRLNEISEQLGLPEVTRDPTRLISLGEEYQKTEVRLRELYDQWQRISTETANA